MALSIILTRLKMQETRVLIIFESSERDSTYDTAIETIAAMSKVVDRLYHTAQKLT